MPTQLSLIPEIIPDSTVELADRRIGRRVNGRGGFQSLPRFLDVVACSTKLGEAFTADTIEGALVKNYCTANIDFAKSEADVARMLWGDRQVALLGTGCATDTTGAVRKAVKRIRRVVQEAQSQGYLLPAKVKVTESSSARRAVVLIQSVLIRLPDQKRKLTEITEAACRPVCDIDAIRYVLPALISPDDWENALRIFPPTDALRWAMVETDRRLTSSIKRANRKGTKPKAEAEPQSELTNSKDRRLGHRARAKVRRKKPRG